MIQDIISHPIVFLAHTVGFIEEGKWPVLGNIPVPQNIRFPSYLIGTGNDCWVESYEGKKIRPATKEDLENLKYRDSYSPAVLEDAVKAKYGTEPLYSYLDDLIYKG